ncbi:hypothetical protein [Vibrio mexicanus]|uniref:hypothetical protein n=1 Tax=Vibrio mexicanus TaxID=1004326 RepID=UPI00063C1A09|nr:hypothetical protein [Vibrio mexicanus]
MYKYVIVLLTVTLSVLTGCEQEPPLIQATIGNAGSISGFYGIRDVAIQTTGGGWTGFGYGAVNGYPGASADIGKMGVPTHIRGTWRKGWNYDDELVYYRIDAPIDSDLAEKKMRTLQDYYEYYEPTHGSMQVVVDEERIQVMYTFACVARTRDCTPRENSDPKGWVERSPQKGVTEVVVLFDGKGESSPVPFD